MSILVSKVSPDVLDRICETGIDHCKNQIKGKDSLAKIMGTFELIKSREGWVHSPDLILNYIAASLIREDEEPNPKSIDQKIHADKVDQLSKEADSGSEFFFRLQELKNFIGFLNMSETEWTQYIESYRVQLSNLKSWAITTSKR